MKRKEEYHKPIIRRKEKKIRKEYHKPTIRRKEKKIKKEIVKKRINKRLKEFDNKVRQYEVDSEGRWRNKENGKFLSKPPNFVKKLKNRFYKFDYDKNRWIRISEKQIDYMEYETQTGKRYYGKTQITEKEILVCDKKYKQILKDADKVENLDIEKIKFDEIRINYISKKEGEKINEKQEYKLKIWGDPFKYYRIIYYFSDYDKYLYFVRYLGKLGLSFSDYPFEDENKYIIIIDIPVHHCFVIEKECSGRILKSVINSLSSNENLKYLNFTYREIKRRKRNVRRINKKRVKKSSKTKMRPVPSKDKDKRCKKNKVRGFRRNRRKK